MKISPINFFNKTKTPQEDEKETQDEKIVETIQTAPTPKNKPAVLRGAGGKFVSKKVLEEKKSQEKEEVKDESPIVEEKTEEVNSRESTPQNDTSDEKPATSLLHISIFRGNNIRKFYEKGQWYFSIIDILTTAKVIAPEKYLLKIKTEMEVNKIPSDTIKAFSENIECVTYSGFIQLLPIMRSCEVNFPGPFPDWLSEISKNLE